jgi:predicted metal-dependent hydrolase
MQLSWFENEPAQLRTLKTFKDLDLTYEDVVIYKQYRSRWVNVSKAITQDTISNLIEVVEDKDAGIYYKLKDKTRSEAISDVKQVLKEWSKNNKYPSDLSEGIIFKEEGKLKN